MAANWGVLEVEVEVEEDEEGEDGDETVEDGERGGLRVEELV